MKLGIHKRLSEPVADPRFEGYPKMRPGEILGRVGGMLAGSILGGGMLTYGRTIARHQVAAGETPFVPRIVYEHLGNIGPTVMVLGALATCSIVNRLARTGGVSSRWERPFLAAATLIGVGFGINAVAEMAPDALFFLPPPDVPFNTVASAGSGDLIAGAGTSIVLGAGLAFMNRPRPEDRAMFDAVANNTPQPADGTVMPMIETPSPAQM